MGNLSALSFVMTEIYSTVDKRSKSATSQKTSCPVVSQIRFRIKVKQYNCVVFSAVPSLYGRDRVLSLARPWNIILFLSIPDSLRRRQNMLLLQPSTCKQIIPKASVSIWFQRFAKFTKYNSYFTWWIVSLMCERCLATRFL